MFINNFEFKINDVKRDRNGNFVHGSFSIKNNDILLVSVYLPKRNIPVLYKDITEIIKEYQNYNIIRGGNWNLILEPQLVIFINIFKNKLKKEKLEKYDVRTRFK